MIIDSEHFVISLLGGGFPGVGEQKKVRCGGTPQPARGTRALPGSRFDALCAWESQVRRRFIVGFPAGRRKEHPGRARYPECCCDDQVSIDDQSRIPTARI